MSHSHEHNNKSSSLLVVLLLTTIYMIAEFLGGLYTNSLALTADAGHMFSDAGALALSFFAIWISQRPASPGNTYGYFRTEILAAFINGIALVGIALFIIYEAYTRIFMPPEVKASTMLAIAFGGLIINIIGAFLLYKNSKENLNIRGAFLHIMGDLLGSIGTIIAGIMILFWNFYLADPIISIIIALLILYSSVRLINEAVQILMEASPSHINVESVKQAILEIPDILDVHDLHVWSISSNKIALSVHIVAKFINNEQILCNVNNLLEERFNIFHSTIQVEPEGFHENECSLKFH